MRARETAAAVLNDAQRQELSRLIALVPEGADESAAEFLALLEYWRGCEVHWPVTIPAYKCNGGAWISGGVDSVIEAIERVSSE